MTGGEKIKGQRLGERIPNLQRFVAIAIYFGSNERPAMNRKKFITGLWRWATPALQLPAHILPPSRRRSSSAANEHDPDLNIPPIITQAGADFFGHHHRAMAKGVQHVFWRSGPPDSIQGRRSAPSPLGALRYGSGLV